MQLQKIEFIKFITKIGIRNEFYNNLGQNGEKFWLSLSTPYTLPRMAVCMAFDWQSTQEGYGFWFNIHLLWERLCRADTTQEQREIYTESYDFVKNNLKQV